MFCTFMDEPITTTPVPTGELKEIIAQAKAVYDTHFDGKVWFGRCIFLSWYCEKGTCTFCFRSVTKKRISDPKKARRSLASVIAEAMLIKGMDWRIEFLTGGYGILDKDELAHIIKLVYQVLEEPIWINLGEMGVDMLEEFKPFVQGIYSSIETTNPEIHKTVCPDKPIQPYVDMMKNMRELGFKNAMTIIIGIGETKDDFPLLEKFIKDNKVGRITIYALRPVRGTPFEHGPNSLDVAWWVAKTRIAFPDIEIIVGTARYRIPEISLFLESGANAITKLPATNMFNTQDAKRVYEEFEKSGRTFTGTFVCEDVFAKADWQAMIDRLDVTDEERESIKKTLWMYLEGMNKKASSLFADSCEIN